MDGNDERRFPHRPSAAKPEAGMFGAIAISVIAHVALIAFVLISNEVASRRRPVHPPAHFVGLVSPGAGSPLMAVGPLSTGFTPPPSAASARPSTPSAVAPVPVVKEPDTKAVEAAAAAALKLKQEKAAEAEATKKVAEDKARAEAAEKAAVQKAKAEAVKKAAAEQAKADALKKATQEKVKAEAEKRAAENKAKAEAAKTAAEEKAKAQAAQKAADEKAKAEAAKKAAEEKAKAEAVKKAAEEKAKAEAAKKAAAEKAKVEAAKKAAAEKKAAEERVRAEAARKVAEAAARKEAEAKALADADRRAEEWRRRNGVQAGQDARPDGGSSGPYASSGPSDAKSIAYTRYFNGMINHIKSNWVLPGSPDPRLAAVVGFGVLADGTISRPRIVERSGNPQYDQSVLNALRVTGRLEPPPAEHRRDFAEVEIVFRPQ